MSKASEQIENIDVTYNLPDLPTAQHKAGLAGLLLMIKSMRRREITPVPEVLGSDISDATLRFDQDNIQALFDDLHGASLVEAKSRSRWANKRPKRVEEETDAKGKTTKRYVYEVVQPDAEFLVPFYPDGDGIWLRLWRQMVWGTLRGIPKTRRVYQERAEGRPSPEGQKCWTEMVKEERARRQGRAHTRGIASSVFVGAQDSNAERVPFRGVPHQNLLLHFWPLACLVFVPRTFAPDGEWRDAGYVVAVPEPLVLDEFLEDVQDLFGSLDPEPAGYRPRGALIDVPAEGGLEYLYHLARRRVAEREIAWSLAAVEVYHLEKRGNNIRTLAAERVLPGPTVLEDYEAIRARFFNPVYKTQRISNLLAGRPRFDGFDAPFSAYPVECFVGLRGRTPARVPFFGNDVRRTFHDIEEKLETLKGETAMPDETWDDALARRVFRMIQHYVRWKTEEKSGVKYEDFKATKGDDGRPIYPKAYREAQEKVCANAFLAMRGRRDEAFVEYFTGTICSVPQFLPQEEYVAVSQALMTDWSTVKTLSMLALSASSHFARGKAAQNEGESK